MQDLRINIGDAALQIKEYAYKGGAVIFLHYSGGNLMMWRDVVSYFLEKFHVVLIDLRGHGKSDKPDKGYLIDEMAQDIIRVMRELKIDQAHVVGSSMGAEIGLSMAANYPEKVLSLVCEGALFDEFGPYGIWAGTEAEFKEYAAERLKKTRDTFERIYPSVDALVDDSRETFEKYGWWNAVFESMVRYGAIKIGEWACKAGWGKAMEEYTRCYLYTRFEDYYPRVECPLLMMPDIYPGQDAREKEIMQGFFELTKRGKIVHVPEWVHPFGWLLTPESGSKAVLEFLEEIQIK